MAGLRLVLDTQVWLDWLVFEDASVARLREAHAAGRVELVIDEPCEAELARVLGYDLGRFSLPPEAREARLARCRALALRVAGTPPAALPACRDPDDQKFLELAAVARAHALLTKDRALLELARQPLPFRICAPQVLEIP
jgi:uncharacterized protein